MVNYNFTSSLHSPMVFGRDVLILVKDKHSSMDATSLDGLPPLDQTM